jgi:hypothetical protein
MMALSFWMPIIPAILTLSIIGSLSCIWSLRLSVLSKNIIQWWEKRKSLFTLPVWSFWQYGIAVVLIFFVSIIAINTLLPESRTDALYFHLQSARNIIDKKDYLRTLGGIDSGGIPFGLSLYVLPAVFVHSNIMARMLVGTSALCLLITMIIGSKLFTDNKESAPHFLIGPLLFFSLPVVGWTASSVYADIPASFFFVLSFVLFAMAWQTKSPRWLPLIALTLTGSMMLKYQLWFYSAILWPLVAIGISWRCRRIPWKSLGLGLLCFLISLSPQLLLNFYQYHNPIYPYQLKSPVDIVTNETIYLGASKTKAPWLTVWNVSVYPQGTNFGGIVGPLPIIAFVFLIFVRKRMRPLALIAGLLGTTVTIFWIYSGVQDLRYLLPIFGIIFLFIPSWFANFSPRWRLAILGLVLAGVFLHLPSFPGRYPYTIWPIPWKQIFLQRKELESWYMRANIPSYTTWEKITPYLKQQKNVRILSLNDSHLYYFSAPSVYLLNNREKLLESTSTPELWKKMKDAGYTYLFESKLFGPYWRLAMFPDFYSAFKPVIEDKYGVLYAWK